MNDEFDSPNLEHKIKLFPCFICVVKATCKNYLKCELITKNQQKIYKFIIQGRCPDCGIKKLINRNLYGVKFKYCTACKHTFIITSNKSELAERK